MNQIITEYETNGGIIPPPPIVKQEIIKEYQDLYKCKYFIETGTWHGDMVLAQKDNFKTIISIELSEALAERARLIFAPYGHIHILQGDSGKLLSQAINGINGQAIFWLDGHFSGGDTAKGDKECPILEEIDAIFVNNKKHIILIDDARCFAGKNSYPFLSDLIDYIKNKDAKYQIEVKHDIIRCVKENTKA